MRIVWSPGAVKALVDGMCGAACSARLSAEMRIRLGRALLKYLNKVSVVKSMGTICGQEDMPPKMQMLCLETGQKLIDAWETCDRQDEERRQALLRSVGLIAANTAMNSTDERVQDFRDRAVSVLFSGLRDGMRSAYEPLNWLRNCPDIDEEQRQEINERLGKAFGLQRTTGEE
jgi:hypothetical protein